MNTLYKQNGQPVEVNDDSLQAALKLGWSKKKPAKKKPPTKTKKAE